MRRLYLLCFCLAVPQIASAYAVLTHEAIIDSAWPDSIQPLLVKRFPNASQEELLKAHAYAYGGSIIQDMGYYPFGSKFFSDLVHYVRSGDFVERLIADSQDLNEYAFALGALAHYTSDNYGHPIAVNPAVALSYPKLRVKYGPVVTFEDNPVAHLKVEFGFDVIEVADGEYAPKAYHDFIGFEVSKELLERSFANTYGLEMKDVFTSVDLALGTYRRTVSTVLPEATKVAWSLKKDEIVKARPGMTRRKFLFNLSRSSYEKEWGRHYERPGLFARFLAFLFRIIPRVGPFRGVEFKPPTPQTSKLFMESFNTTLSHYRAFLADVGGQRLQLPNRDFDTGGETRAGEYKLADDAYSKLARTLAEKRFARATPEVQRDILHFFQNTGVPIATKRHKGMWRDTLQALAQLKTWSPAPAADQADAPR